MAAQYECFVSGALATTLRIGRFAGLAPLRFTKKGQGWRVSLFSRVSIISIIIILLTNLMIIAALTQELQAQLVNQLQISTRDVSSLMESLGVLVTATTIVCSASGHMQCLITASNKVQKINSKLGVHHWPKEWKRKQTGLFLSWILLCMVVFCRNIAIAFIATRKLEQPVWVTAAYALRYMYEWVIVLGLIQFLFLILHVRSSFIAVNNSLKELLQGDGISINWNGPYKAVRTISWAYSSACDVVREVSSFYGLVLMILLAIKFLHLIITPYHFINDLITNYNSVNESMYEFGLLEVYWYTFHIISLITIIEPCHLTHVEMETTRKLASDLMQETRSVHDPLAIELELFCSQLAFNQVSYRPLNITVMSRELLITIFGSITTYIVFMVGIK